MSKLRLFTLLIILMVITLPLVAKKQKDTLSPSTIDIYKYDPLQGGVADSKELIGKATAHYQKADYENAIRWYLAYLTISPEDASTWYNLSCCYGLLGKAEYAAKYLKIAYKKGFTDLAHVERDTDFGKVKADKAFVNAVDSLRTWNERKTKYMGKMEYFPSQHYLPYRIHIPQNYNSEKPATLLIGLHGYGDKAYNFAWLWRHIEDSNIIFVVPEAPYPFVEGETAAYSWSPHVERGSEVEMQAYKFTERYILELAQNIATQYKIDQTWLMGFSQGCYIGYMITLKNPERFAGFLACGGGLINEVFSEEELKNANTVKVIISHGKEDKVIRFEEATKAYETLSKYGYDLTLHEFDGAHRVSEEGMKLMSKKMGLAF